jgi:hypothetical protein
VLDFVKSVDSVYKEFRLLNASIENSSRIDKAFETLFNIPFYALVATMILIQLDFDPLAVSVAVSVHFIRIYDLGVQVLRFTLFWSGDRMALEIEFMSVMWRRTQISLVRRDGKPCFGSFGSGKTNCILTLPLRCCIPLRLSKISRYSRRLLFGDQREMQFHRN